MTRATGRRDRLPAQVAWVLFGVTVLLAGVQTWFFLGWSVVREDASSWPVLTVGLTLWAALGAVIISNSHATRCRRLARGPRQGAPADDADDHALSSRSGPNADLVT